jgi:hypothetical protein
MHVTVFSYCAGQIDAEAFAPGRGCLAAIGGTWSYPERPVWSNRRLAAYFRAKALL